MMNDHGKNEMIHTEGDFLFDRVISILEQARGNVVRSGNEFEQSLGHPSLLPVHQWDQS